MESSPTIVMGPAKRVRRAATTALVVAVLVALGSLLMANSASAAEAKPKPKKAALAKAKKKALAKAKKRPRSRRSTRSRSPRSGVTSARRC